MTAPTVTADHARFVADARRYYVPAIRWARANGWETPRLRSKYRDVEIHKSDAWNGHYWQPTFVVRRKFSTLREEFYPTSVRQAIDFLVVAGILPTELASLTPKKPQPWCQYVDDLRYGIHCGAPADPASKRCPTHENALGPSLIGVAR